ncbi:ribosome-binding factor A [Marmoricola sp. RAF53]|uniref:ribosome-binding factor A n=1 Tax=Marmoricola sp. RAF53 TaxID=3233059 RepID=UPI003F990148
MPRASGSRQPPLRDRGRVSGDTQQATVFYTALNIDGQSGEPEDLAATAAALESAKGLIRSEVAKQLGMRHAPSVEFIHDALPETARAIDDLLEKVREQDAAVAEVATGAVYAGEADPYKKPREADEDLEDLEDLDDSDDE